VLGALKLLLSGDSADQSLTALAVPDTEPDSSSAASESYPVRLDRVSIALRATNSSSVSRRRWVFCGIEARSLVNCQPYHR